MTLPSLTTSVTNFKESKTWCSTTNKTQIATPAPSSGKSVSPLSIPTEAAPVGNASS